MAAGIMALPLVGLFFFRIYENGHGDYEDGIVINGADTGTISNVVVRRNLFFPVVTEKRHSGCGRVKRHGSRIRRFTSR